MTLVYLVHVYIIFRAELENRPEKDRYRDIQTDRQTDNALKRVDRANCAMCGLWTLILLVIRASLYKVHVRNFNQQKI